MVTLNQVSCRVKNYLIQSRFMCPRKQLLVIFLFISSSLLLAQHSGGNLFDLSALHEIRVTFDEPNFWEILVQNYESGTSGGFIQPKPGNKNFQEFYMKLQENVMSVNENNIPLLDGNISIDGTIIDNIGIRLKGYSSYWSSTYIKKSIKVDLNGFVDTLNYFGIEKFNLNNGVGDPSFQRDVVCYGLMRKAGVAAPRTAYAKVYLNDIYWGLYLIVEQVDKNFLEDHFASGNGDLYKNMGWSNLEYISDNFADYSNSIELKTNVDESQGKDYIDFVKAINQTNGDKFYEAIQKNFYVDYYLKVLAIDIMTKNWDSYIQHGRNFYLYHEPVSNLFYWIPWDYNLALDGQFDWWSGSTTSQHADSLMYTYDTIGLQASFHFDTTGIKNITQLLWDFGDGTWGDGQQYLPNPVHTYTQPGIYPAKVSLNFWDGSLVEVKKSVLLMDTTGLCHTVISMPYAYYPTSNYQAVYDIDSICCDCNWDNVCSKTYERLQSYNPDIDDVTYPIDYVSYDKPLIMKILADTRFKNRYLDIFKYILDSVFVPEDIFNTINHNYVLIRDAVYADTNYLFSIDKFEYDMNILCNKGSYQITNIKHLIEARERGLKTEYASLNYNPQPIEPEIKMKDVVINELAANNKDNDGNSTSDWFELYNTTDKIISLRNFAVSDSADDKYKFVLPDNTAIMPDGYFIIWADKKDKKNNIHANFKLSADGEELYLSHLEYGVIDSVIFGPQELNMSYSRVPNGTGPFVIKEPTFNRHNTKVSEVDVPEISDENSNFEVYPNPVSEYITIQATDENQKFSVKIFNSTGAIVYNKTELRNSVSIEVQSFPPGMYFVEILQNKTSEKFKIVIAH
jgi:PKD repeat protein